MKKNKTKLHTLRIDSLAAGGDGVGRLGGKVCFVPLTAPGDEVEVRVVKESGKFKRCEMVSLITPGPDRRQPRCPLFGTCGGCMWQHIEKETQIEAKRSILKRVLHVDEIQMISSPSEFGYRQLARIHVDKKTESLGFMKREQNTVVDVEKCDVLKREINESLKPLRQALLANMEGRLELRIALGVAGPAVSIISSSPLLPSLYSKIEELVPDHFTGFEATVDGVHSNICGEYQVTTIGADGGFVREPVASFGQANREVDVILGRTVASWIEERKYNSAIELFAGAGNLTVAIAPYLKKLTTVELDSRACAAARENLANRNLKGANVSSGDALDLYYKFGSKHELVVLDPPRTGHMELSKVMAKGDHLAIIYVSCNPATLSRDLKELYKGGYILKKSIGLDMFPQTSHIEAAVLLEK